jgi:hypothetical protein
MNAQNVVVEQVGLYTHARIVDAVGVAKVGRARERLHAHGFPDCAGEAVSALLRERAADSCTVGLLAADG